MQRRKHFTQLQQSGKNVLRRILCHILSCRYCGEKSFIIIAASYFHKDVPRFVKWKMKLDKIKWEEMCVYSRVRGTSEWVGFAPFLKFCIVRQDSVFLLFFCSGISG